jgi:hypothetical protein
MITWAQLWLSNREMRIEELGVELMAKQGAVLPKQTHPNPSSRPRTAATKASNVEDLTEPSSSQV